MLALFLTVLNVVFITYRKRHFYNYAKQTLNLSSATLDFKIESVGANDDIFLNYEIKKIIENFKNNNAVVAVGLNMNHEATVSSNKSSCETYNYLIKIIKQKNLKTLNEPVQFKLSNGENIMLKIKPISSINCEFSAIMLIMSLKKYDNMILKTEFICLILSLIIFGLVFITGQLFIKMLLKPILKISAATKKIANNQIDLNIKNFLTNKSGNELTNLCNSINLIYKKLRHSEYAQNEFISSISHELRTPLTAIKGWSETILNSNFDKKITIEGTTIISKEITRLSNMIEELLDFSKIRNNHIKLFKEKMDPFAELQEAILIYNSLAKEQKKILIYKEQAIIPTILGDRNRIKQVFINIIDNALKYSDKGAIIEISAIVSKKTADVIIKDSGRGIAKQNLNQITKKFFKANNQNKGSSGIGLAVVKEIVQRHGGTLTFESKLNKGTTVKISFPLYNNK